MCDGYCAWCLPRCDPHEGNEATDKHRLISSNELSREGKGKVSFFCLTKWIEIAVVQFEKSGRLDTPLTHSLKAMREDFCGVVLKNRTERKRQRTGGNCECETKGK